MPRRPPISSTMMPTLSGFDAASLCESLRARLEQDFPQIIEQCPPDDYIAALDSIEGYGGYREFGNEATRIAGRIEQLAGLPGIELYHRFVLARLMSRFERDGIRHALPASVKDQYLIEFQRIAKFMTVARPGTYLPRNDGFCKDLAICRGKLLPCGAQLVDVRSGVPRRILGGGGLGQAMAAGHFFGMRTGGFRPFYEMHLDPRAMSQFSPAGWDACYLRIAELLELNPDIRGVFGSSWWFDPEVERNSPTIAWLRRRPLDGGARVFRAGSGESAVNDALKFSPQRKALYDAGRYEPTIWSMVWARSDLLAWAKSVRNPIQGR